MLNDYYCNITCISTYMIPRGKTTTKNHGVLIDMTTRVATTTNVHQIKARMFWGMTLSTVSISLVNL